MVQMLFVQRYDMVQDLAAATSNPAFRDPVLPGCLHACLFGLQAGRGEKLDYACIKSRITVEDYVPVGGSLRERFAQLLQDPI
jgi:hypothetical protein